MTSRRAFTLLELIVVLVVLGLLAAIAIPTFQRVTEEAALTAETETLAAVARNAAALAALDRETLPTPEHLATAFSELPQAMAPGVSAYQDAGTYRIYTQAEWFVGVDVPADKRAVILAVDEILGLAGMAILSDVDPTQCIMVRMSSLGSIESFNGTVDGLEDCDGTLALAGPTEPGNGGGDGGGEENPLGPEMIQPGIVLLGDSVATAGALDNVEILDADDDVALADDFNRANGPLGEPWLTFQGVFPVPVVSSNQVTGSSTAPAVAIRSVPDGPATISADVTAVPAEGQAAIHMIRMAEAGSEAQVQVGEDMQARVVVAVPGHPNTYMAARSTAYEVGDRIELRRENTNEFTGLVNGVAFSEIDRSEIGAFRVAVDVADPAECHLGFFDPAVTVPDGTTAITTFDIESPGPVDFFVPGGVQGRVGAWCNTTEGFITFFYGGADLASATTLTSPVADTVDLGTFGPNGGGLEVPAAPTGFTAVASGVSANLSWDAQADVTFDVDRDGTVIASDLTATTFTNGSLTEATSYGYRVRACNAAGCSDWTAAQTVATRPSTPTNFRYTGASTSALAMAWDAAPTATSYQVQSQTPAATVTVAGTTHTESGLPQATTFNWRVAACNAAGCSTPTSYSPMTTGGSLTHVATSNNSSQNSLTDTVNTVHNWTVPAGVKQVRFSVVGAGGAPGAVCNGTAFVGVASSGGAGGFRAGTFNMTPGTVVEYYAGRLGTGRFGGWPGGGSATAVNNCNAGGAGGGRSGVRLGVAANYAPFVEAGGGGGGSNRFDGGTTAGSGGAGIGGGNNPAGGGSAGSVSGAGFPLGGAGGNGPGGSPGGGGGWASACGGPCGGWTYQNGNAGAGFDGAAARPWAGAGGGGTGPGGGGAVIYATVFGTGAGGGGGGGHGRTAVVGYTSSNLTSGTAGSVSNGSVTICWHGSTACGTTPVFLP
jgi:prepilin-type N-terminal cleavage/methylation domain-containing protein